jgi:hypothetical protein
VKQPGTLVRHEGRDYLLVEGGYDEATRAVILLARPADPRVASETTQRPLRWGSQGEWLPLARWTPAELRIPDANHEAQREFAQGVIGPYVAARTAPAARAWAGRKGTSLAFQIHASLPMGLAAGVFDTQAAAAALPEVEQVVPIDNLGMFFTHLVREGYAGALWNGSQPVFFCIDDEGDLQFLRVSPAGSEVAMEILDERDRWQKYDGAEAVEFIDNREACDQRLVAALGNQPPSGWPADGKLWSLGPSAGVPHIFTTAEGSNEVRHAVLFGDEQSARDYGEERAPQAQPFAVTDLTGFLTSDAMAGNVAAFNPGGHRARSGLLWSDGERVVLDSYSGFWKVEGQRFEAIDVAADQEA